LRWSKLVRQVSVKVDDPDLSAETDYDGAHVYQNPSVDVEVGGGELKPTNVSVKTNRFAETAIANVTGLWQAPGSPEKGHSIQIDINGYRVFTGIVESPEDKGNGAVKVKGHDFVKQLIRTKFSRSFDQAPLRTIAEFLINEANNAFWDISNLETELPGDIRVSPDFTNVPGTQTLDKIAKWGNVLWWVDERNVVHVAPADPEIHIFGPEFVKSEPSAGEKTIPYQKVVVLGESPASQSSGVSGPGGLGAMHMLAKEPIVATAGDGEPVYRYQSKQIRTQQQAENVAQAVLDEFKRQRATGTVTIAGEGPPIRPLDVVEMPEEIGSERYLVSTVKHTFNNDDGLITDIDCGGLIDGEVQGES
jgi:hypothetical protein